MLRLPKKVVMLAGLLAAVPSVTLAGPFDFLKPKSDTVVSAQSERTNQQVANEIAAALKQAKLKGFDINIEFADGVATLNGKISDASQKAAATKAASQIDGVVTVNNQLELVSAPQGPAPRPAPRRGARQAGPIKQVAHERASRNNQQVAQQIADSLVAAGLKDSGIEVRYKEGGCSLSGDLATPQQAMTAYQLASRVPGVEHVLTSNLTVAGQPFTPPAIQPAGYNQHAMMQQLQGPGMPGPGFPQPIHPAAAQYAAPQGVQPAGFGHHGPYGGGLSPHEVYNSPNLPDYAWPTQAAYDNYAAVSYPSQYDASAWPYIGPFYPYPQVPLGWRDAQLSWDDGYWNLKFNSRTDKWWWFLNPENWD